MNSRSESRTLSVRLFRHLLGEYLILLGCCLVGFIVLFLVGEIFDELVDFLRSGASAGATAAYFLMRQPANLAYVLPMSILLSLTFVMNGMIRHQELTAVRASGLSVVAMALPVWLVAAVLTPLIFLVNEWVGPVLYRQSLSLRERLTRDEGHERPTHALLAYRNRQAHRHWFFEVFSQDGVQRGVSLKQLAPKSAALVWEIRAGEAEYLDGSWTFRRGTLWIYSAEDMLPEAEQRFDTLTRVEVNEPPSEIFNDLRPLRELSAIDMFRYLRKNDDLPPESANPMATTFWYRVSMPLSCLIASLYGVGLSMRRQRAGPFWGFAAALGMMALYYGVTQFMVLLGKHGVLPPLVAGGLPPWLFVAHGIAIVYRRR